ncbi:MAG: hypothetical protein GY925_14365 [Actinomycetia bacterium]|nr:hypothetical protein [Actinomycetes bacterium]
MTRSHVSFAGLWSMAIDVPYSYLLRDGDLAWTCGQLALDSEANAIHNGDLAAQSSVVCDHVDAILERAGLSRHGVQRLYLYHANSPDDAIAAMLDVITDRLGSSVDLVPLAVPHFYYDGVVLEVDVFWGGPAAELRWVHGPGGRSRLSEHIVSPSDSLTDHVEALDPGAVIDGGPHLTETRWIGVDVADGVVRSDVGITDSVSVVSRRSEPFLWLQGRSTDEGKSLVAQTEALMRRLAEVLATHGYEFTDVVKSTTHYIGGNTAEELHDNMSVRNAYYRSPGPASTGVPVHGFADPRSKIVVDLTLIRR